jgi:glucosyl-dolichyl phosphate glucuronosyltransferase
MHVDASVIICTYTEARWDDLRAAISSVASQRVTPIETIVVIDHNAALLQRAQAELHDVTVVKNQDQRGLSGARNTGVKVARSSLIVFLDDDAVADPLWLQSLTHACTAPNVLGSGGVVEPAWATGKPSWLPEEFYWVVGCSYRGLPITRCPVRNLIGSSMCIRREVFDSIGYFRGDVGRVDAHPVGCEETELCIRARQRWPERAFLYEPAGRILHRVPASRATWGYFCSRCFFEGHSKAQVADLAGARDGLSSERTYTFSALPKGIVHNLWLAISHGDMHGLTRAGAIVAGLSITVAGYATGTWKLWLRRAVYTYLRAIRPEPIYLSRTQHEEGD